MKSEQWKTYRTRFLVKAKQLSSTLSFVDALGRQHSGRKGDYLVESSDGVVSIASRQIFEDIYVPMSLSGSLSDSLSEDPGSNQNTGQSTLRKKPVSASTSRLNFEPLEVEQVKLGKRQNDRQRLDDRGLILRNAGAPEIVASDMVTRPQGLSRPDQPARVRRKLPQPCRDRRASTHNLRFM